jgi:hypothetical protein
MHLLRFQTGLNIGDAGSEFIQNGTDCGAVLIDVTTRVTDLVS